MATINQKVLIWAKGQLGKQVGRGECWDLGESALKQAGAQTSNDLGPIGDDIDYIWGDPVSIKDTQPGDIIQIRDHVTTTTTVTHYEYDDGASEDVITDETFERPHHTAIVSALPDSNLRVATLEQNVEPAGKKVQTKTLITKDVPAAVTQSTVNRVNPISKKTQSAKATKTVTVTVTGKMWAYRPKAK